MFFYRARFLCGCLPIDIAADELLLRTKALLIDGLDQQKDIGVLTATLSSLPVASPSSVQTLIQLKVPFESHCSHICPRFRAFSYLRKSRTKVAQREVISHSRICAARCSSHASTELIGKTRLCSVLGFRRTREKSRPIKIAIFLRLSHQCTGNV